MVLTADQIKALNEGTLGGNIQKVAFQIRRKYQDVIEVLNVRDNSYPLPQQIDEYFNVTIPIIICTSYEFKIINIVADTITHTKLYGLNFNKY